MAGRIKKKDYDFNVASFKSVQKPTGEIEVEWEEKPSYPKSNPYPGKLVIAAGITGHI